MNPLNRFLSVAIIGIGCLLATTPGVVRAIGMKAPWPNLALTFAYDAFEPIISKETMETLHLDIQQKYLDTANELILEHPTAKNMDQRTIIKEMYHETEIYDNFVHYWNIEFFWSTISPGGRRGRGGVPDDFSFVAIAIEKEYDTYDKFLMKIKDVAMKMKGNGWVWLCWDGESKKLEIVETTGAGNPITDGLEPVLVINMWEHAYKSNTREDYVNGFFDNLVNWAMVDANMMMLPGVYKKFNPILEERVFAMDPYRKK